ncbi:MAG: Fur family transcriptional regulator [Bryobacteraceae bacterium]
MTRNTKQRKAIRDAFEQANRPLSAEEVLSAAQAQTAGLGIATVYRTIKSLAEEGWLVPVELPGEAPRYELAGKEHHHHFHCRECGKVYEIEGCLENLKRMIPPGYLITGHEVVLYGLCSTCAQSRKRSTSRIAYTEQ